MDSSMVDNIGGLPSTTNIMCACVCAIIIHSRFDEDENVSRVVTTPNVPRAAPGVRQSLTTPPGPLVVFDLRTRKEHRTSKRGMGEIWLQLT
jgi:hypothetical protein